MRITEEQEKKLCTLRCERLSSNSNNFRAIEGFYNSKNERLSDDLKNEAYHNDENNRIAYYLVKDQYGNILFYFSLKCGQLYDKYINVETYKQLKELLEGLLEIENDEKSTIEDKKLVGRLIEDIRTRAGVLLKDIKKISKKNKKVEDFEKSLIDGTDKVGATFSGVEIVQFCSNDEHSDVWARTGIPQKLGVVVFWRFVVDIIHNLMEIVGCEYVFLFAADKSEDGLLINYYKTRLGFDEADGRSATTPLYDLSCRFLYQPTNMLEEKRRIFYDSFNPESDAV